MRRLILEALSHVEPCGINPLNLPSAGECLPQLALRYPPRTPLTRRELGEAEKVDHAVGLEHRSEALDVARPIGVVEGMKDAGVEGGREPSPEPIERQHVTLLELGAQPPLGGLLSRKTDGRRRDVDAQHLQPALGQHERVLARAAAAIQDRRGELAGIGQAYEYRLRSTDIPRRPPLAVRLVPTATDRAGPATVNHDQWSMPRLGWIDFANARPQILSALSAPSRTPTQAR